MGHSAGEWHGSENGVGRGAVWFKFDMSMLACELVQVNGHCKLLALRVGKQVGRWTGGLGVGGEEAWRDTRGA